MDAAGLTESELQKYASYVNSCGSIITLKSPLLANIDHYGLFYGFAKSAVDLVLPNIASGILKKGGLIKWAFFLPCSTAVKEISDLVTQRKVSLIIKTSLVLLYSTYYIKYNIVYCCHVLK